MATHTFWGNQEQWEVPPGNNEVTVRCWGAAGGDGRAEDASDSGEEEASTSSGGNGGYAEGDLYVSEGDTLYLMAGDKGDGGNGPYESNYQGWADAGDGGGASEVRVNGTNTGDIVILAGGGGGGGAAWAEANEDPDSITSNSSASSSSGGDGGGTATDAGDINDDAQGGHGGSASGYNGESGDGYYSNRGGGVYGSACGGGGGDGWNGGTGGGASAYDFNGNSVMDGAGGGGGDGYTGGVHNSAQSVGVRGGNGKVEVDYTVPTPATPTGLSITTNSDGSVTLTWNDDADWNDGYEIYRSTSSGVDDSDTLVATAGENQTSYTDSPGQMGTYYYTIRATTTMDGVTKKSSFSSEESVTLTSFYIYDGFNWVAAQMKVYDGSNWVSASSKYWDGSNWN